MDSPAQKELISSVGGPVSFPEEGKSLSSGTVLFADKVTKKLTRKYVIVFFANHALCTIGRKPVEVLTTGRSQK